MLGLMLAGLLTFVELNCENLFDCVHDSLKQDEEFLPEGSYHWTRSRYWLKVNHIAQELAACGGPEMQMPGLIALCEVENDSVLTDLTRRSLLRKMGYEYLMTHSPDARGIDVALVYKPQTFVLVCSYALRVPLVKHMRPTRDILYASGRIISGDTLHVFVVHAPSRLGGEVASRPFRMQVAKILCLAIDSLKALNADARIIVAGDFNDYTSGKSLSFICTHGMTDVSAQALGRNGAKGTYRYHGEWGSLDHILVSNSLLKAVAECYVADEPFLLEDDEKYGGKKPRRNYLGPKYLGGFSDHLPLVAKFRITASEE